MKKHIVMKAAFPVPKTVSDVPAIKLMPNGQMKTIRKQISINPHVNQLNEWTDSIGKSDRN